MNSIKFFIVTLTLCPYLGEVIGQGEIITSPPITNWGDWGTFQKCPNGTFAQGFQVKTEPYRGAVIDDTAGNGVRLFCGDPLDPETPSITSSEGAFGNWGDVFSCGNGGYIYGFELKVEGDGILDDETATNNVRVFCSNNPDPEAYLEGDGLNFGRWTDIRKCATTQALCGLQTQVQIDQGILVDDTSLNNVAAECCDVPPATTPPPSTTTAPTTPPPTTPAPTTQPPTTQPPTTQPPTTQPPTTQPPTTQPPTTQPPTTQPPTTQPPTTQPPTTQPPTTQPPTTQPPTTQPPTTQPPTTQPPTTQPPTTQPPTTQPPTTQPPTTQPSPTPVP